MTDVSLTRVKKEKPAELRGYHFSDSNQEKQNLTLFVGSLSERTTQGELVRYFSKFGSLASVNLIADWTTGASKCCAIVICRTPTTMTAILQSKHFIDGKKIRVGLAEPDRKGTKKISTNFLFVGNIPSRTKEPEFKAIFQKFGSILDLKFFRNASTKACTKNCIIEYTDSLAVEMAFKEKDSKEFSQFGYRVSPLKHKSPNKKSRSKKDTHTLNLEIKQQSESDFEREEEELEWDIENSNLSPIPYPNQFDFSQEEPSESCQFNNKNKADWSQNTLASETRSQGSEEEDLFPGLVTLADFICEDDLASIFFGKSPFLGHLKPKASSKVDLSSY